MTLEAWVFPTANGSGSWRNVLIKERAAGEADNLYANIDANHRRACAVARRHQRYEPFDVRGGTQLSVNTWTHLALTFGQHYAALYTSTASRSSRVRSRGRC